MISNLAFAKSNLSAVLESAKDLDATPTLTACYCDDKSVLDVKEIE